MVHWFIFTASFVLTLALIPPFVYLAALTAAALVARSGRVKYVAGTAAGRFKFVFVIPAQDEESGISCTVSSCNDVDYPREQFRVVVVADNCADRTAERARLAGAEVLERTDLERRGKGFALKYFFRAEPPDRADQDYDAVVIIDADTKVDRSILTAFGARIAQGQDWLQCYNTVRNPDVTWRTRLMTLAFSLCNGVLLIGQNRLGLSIGLRGNGMCLTRRGLARHPWEADGLTEDIEFSWMLRSQGERIYFVREARVYSDMVGNDINAAKSQRMRWEEGRRSMRARFLHPLLFLSNLSVYEKLMYLLELTLPSLVSLMLLLILAASAHLLGRPDSVLGSLSWWLRYVHGLMAAVLLAYVLSPFVVLRLPRRYLRSLLYVSRYAVWKLALGLSPRPSSWVRTAREPRSDGLQEELMRPLPQHNKCHSEKQTEASAPACQGISPSE